MRRFEVIIPLIGGWLLPGLSITDWSNGSSGSDSTDHAMAPVERNWFNPKIAHLGPLLTIVLNSKQYACPVTWLLPMDKLSRRLDRLFWLWRSLYYGIQYIRRFHYSLCIVYRSCQYFQNRLGNSESLALVTWSSLEGIYHKLGVHLASPKQTYSFPWLSSRSGEYQCLIRLICY